MLAVCYVVLKKIIDVAPVIPIGINFSFKNASHLFSGFYQQNCFYAELLFCTKMHHTLVFISKTVFRQNFFFVRKCITLVFLFLSVELFFRQNYFPYENASHTCFLVFICKTVLGRITFLHKNASHLFSGFYQ